MKQTRRLLRLLTLSMLFCLPLQAQAADTLSLDGLRKNIEAFKSSPDSRFAPDTIKRAEAYLGAAMLASDKHNDEDVSSALEKAGEKLQEARQTAGSFQQKYSELLKLRVDAIAVVKAHDADAQAERNPTYMHLIDNAEAALNSSIQNMESGQLNQTQQHADKAKALYAEALAKTISWLAEEAAAAVAKAASASAKQYAPVSYQAAKKKAGELRAFVAARTSTMPPHPIEALHLAVAAKALTLQVKKWRRRTGSHEDNALREKAFRQKLAKTLGLPVAENALLADVSNEDLLQATSDLKKKLADERKAREADSVRLKKHYKAELDKQRSQLREELLTAKNTQLAEMKDAFRTKMKRTEEGYRSELEKETFETKRQKAVHALFKEREVSILANLDGSLIIRLSSLGFGSSKSKIDSKYFDMLGRLKEALDIYSDRNVRLEGHTDNQGGVKANQKLSLKRAEAVRDFLIAAGTDGGRLKALGYGEVRPIASNEFKKGRAMNRRIDVAIAAAE